MKQIAHVVGWMAWVLLSGCTPTAVNTIQDSGLRLPVQTQGENKIVLFSDKDENRDPHSLLLADATEGKESSGVQITYKIIKDGYGGFAIPLGGKDLSGYESLIFWTRQHHAKNARIYIQIVSTGGLRRKFDLSPSLAQVGPDWRRIRVPLDTFRNAPKEILASAREIAIVFLTGKGIVDFGEFVFEGTAPATPKAWNLLNKPLPSDLASQEGRAFEWSGHQWKTRSVTDNPIANPGPNRWSASKQSVWVDPSGKLHLALRFFEGQWYCSEVLTERSLGYGRYVFYVDSPIETIDRNVVLGLFTYLDDENEIDIEFTKWGENRTAVHEQFTIQPYSQPGNISRADYVPRTGGTTCAFTWLKDRIVFKCFEGTDIDRTPPYRVWTYTGQNIPKPADEKLHINIWLFRGLWPEDMTEHELVLSRFEFVPAGGS